MPEFLDGDHLVRLLFVLGVDLILAGDNAVVIALAVRRLEGSNRRKAILWGTFGAVVLRLIFAAVVIYLLQIPLLQAAAALLLLWIAWKLVNDGPEEESNVQPGKSTGEAIRIIILADVVMSLDNVFALVGASEGNLPLLAIGVAITIPLVIFGSTLLTSLLDRFPMLVYAGAGLLVYIAVEMFFADTALHGYLEPLADAERLIAVSTAVIFIAATWLWNQRLAAA